MISYHVQKLPARNRFYIGGLLVGGIPYSGDLFSDDAENLICDTQLTSSGRDLTAEKVGRSNLEERLLDQILISNEDLSLK